MMFGTRELLTIMLAIEEWRHWLEGAHHPFLVLIDHRNLEYLKSAKRLNPRHARWALFTRFTFTVNNLSGKKNVKAYPYPVYFTPLPLTQLLSPFCLRLVS
jgi:hypothetical protein